MIYTRLDRVLRYLRNRKVRPYIFKDSTLCDIGCGSEPKLLLEMAPYIRAGIGLDKQVESRQFSNIILKRETIGESVSLASESMDIVTMLAVIEHLENPAQVLSEARRILRKNGRLIITTPSRYNKPLGNFLSLKLGLINPEAYLDHKNYFISSYLEIMLKNSGFRIIKLQYWELFLNLFIVAEKL